METALATLKPATIVRLVLGDQLNEKHSWFSDVRPDVLYVVAELHEEATYVRHHIQKVVTFFQAMSSFADARRRDGHRVLYLTLDDTVGQTTHQVIASVLKQTQATQYDYQRPDEWRLLNAMRSQTYPGVDVLESDTEHFLVPLDEMKPP